MVPWLGVASLALAEDPLPEDLSEFNLPPPLPLWQPFYSVRTGGGYKDNVLFSNLNRQESAFVNTGLEFFLARLPDSSGQAEVFLSFNDIRFLEPIDVDKEQVGFAQAHWAPSLAEDFRGEFAVEYIFQDQVLDVSATEADLTVVKVTGHTLVARPGFHWDIYPERWWTELSFAVERQWFEPPLDDYTEAGPEWGIGYQYSRQSEFRLSYDFRHRSYDEEAAYTTGPDPSPIPGTQRTFRQHDARFRWRHHWDEEQRWRSTLNLGWKANDDNSTGYFNFDRFRVGGELRFRSGPWDLRAEAVYSEYRYQEQTVSNDDPDKRNRKEWQLRFRLERQLAKFLKVYGEFEREETNSNVEEEEYTIHTANGGLLWEF